MQMGLTGTKAETLRLDTSPEPAIRTLALPDQDEPKVDEIVVGERKFITLLQRLEPLRMWLPRGAIVESSWVLGLFIPAEVVYTSGDST